VAQFHGASDWSFQVSEEKQRQPMISGLNRKLIVLLRPLKLSRRSYGALQLLLQTALLIPGQGCVYYQVEIQHMADFQRERQTSRLHHGSQLPKGG
jgi:hypothetical protein